jgi:hypothetical protein
MAELTLKEKIIAEFPELEGSDLFWNNTINLVDRSDGKGVVIARWDYSKPLPESLTGYLG